MRAELHGANGQRIGRREFPEGDPPGRVGDGGHSDRRHPRGAGLRWRTRAQHPAAAARGGGRCHLRGPRMTDELTPPSLGRASAALAAGTWSRASSVSSAPPCSPGRSARRTRARTRSRSPTSCPTTSTRSSPAGVLSAVLVPQIVRAGLHADGGQLFVNRLVTLGVVVFLAATAHRHPVRPAARRPVHARCGDGGALGGGRALAVAFAYWCLPQIFFYAIYSLLGEVLNARGVFGPFTWAPVLNNVVVIIALLASSPRCSASTPRTRIPRAGPPPRSRCWRAARRSASRRRRSCCCCSGGAPGCVPPRLPLAGRRPRRHRACRGLDLRR